MSHGERRRAGRMVFAVVGAGALATAALWLRPAASQVVDAKQLAPGVYFQLADRSQGHCNNGFIVFDDYVLVIDANFPSGAQQLLPKIKAVTDRPVRFVHDTHHHGDHAYGNQFWVENGATPVAHTNVIAELKKYETGYYGDKPGRWEEAAAQRKDVAATRLKPPTVLFPKELIFDDGKRRVELVHLGVAHTRGDSFAWLPKEKILFTGDACVNGPFNYVGDGSVDQWIRTMEAAKKLGATTVVPGHGPVGDARLLEDQRLYFATLWQEVKQLKARYRTPKEVQAHLEEARPALQRNPQTRKYVGDSFAAHVEKIYLELGGKPFPTSEMAASRQGHDPAQRLRLLELGRPMEWDQKLTRRAR